MYKKLARQSLVVPALENFGQDPEKTRAFTLCGIWNHDNPEELGYHDFHQVLTVEQGVFILYDGMFQQPLYKGSAAFIPANVPHRVFALQDHIEAETMSIYYSKEYFPEAGHTISIFPLTELSGALMRELVKQQLTSFSDRFSMQCVDLLALSVAGDSKNAAARLRLPVAEDERIQNAVNYIQKNCHRKISLSDIARSVYLSSRQLSRLFIDTMGITAFEYLRMYRILSILPEITDSNKKIVESVFSSGYETVSSFYRDFSFFLGMPP
ncbi:MAG: AraC family transcriptional regulator [Spirochaetales bacterium]|jgi:AraC-like DNA-binding protein|nr:AraC family transcriptional regulator [Spirochaetales bacterium]